MNTTSRILLNTTILYLKVIFTTIISLYLTRVVFNVLGVEDYGLYSLIAGVVSFMSFLNTALMSSTQRFLSVAIGEKNTCSIRQIFSSSIIMHLVLALIIVIIIELASFFLFADILNIPSGREKTAIVVLHIMVATTFFTILSAPYNAAINSYEDMWFFAIVEIFASILKLCVIWGFQYITIDHLVLYTGWIFVITLICYIVKIVWCHVKYQDIRYTSKDLTDSKATIKSMIGFIGWNTMGAFAVILRNQGVAIVLNIFFTTAINAVYGIANQVSSQLSYFSQMMTTSMTPQIMKSKGENNEDRLIYLSCLTSKLSYFLSTLFAIPLIINIDFVLDIWLGEAPKFANYYCITSIIIFLIMQLYPGLNRAIQADGRIKSYNIWLTIIMLLPIFISGILFMTGISHKVIMIMMIIAQVAIMILTIESCNKLIRFSTKNYYKFIIKAIVTSIGIISICLLIKSLYSETTGWHVPIMTTIISITLCCATFYSIILSAKEQTQIKIIIKNLIKHD